MRFQGWMVLSLGLLLGGCDSISEAGSLTEGEPIAIDTWSLANRSAVSEEAVGGFDRLVTWSINGNQTLESYVFIDWEAFYQQAIGFYETQVQSSTATGILVQASPYVLTFQPKSPFFVMWEPDVSLPLSELLAQVDGGLSFNPSGFVTSFLEALNDRLPEANFTIYDRGYINATEGTLQLASLQQEARSMGLSPLLSEAIFGRNVVVSETEDVLQVVVQLKETDGEEEEFTRNLSSMVLTVLQAQPEALLAFEELSLEIQTADGDLVGTVDLTVSELFALPWKGQLTHALAEPLPYFRYYGAIEFE